MQNANEAWSINWHERGRQREGCVVTDQSGNGCAAGTTSPISGAARPFLLVGKEIGMEWKDQYKHPNWQKKRLEALDAAEYRCENCMDGESQLHVHHKRYVKGRAIWEYDLSELSVLCDGCHEDVHSKMADLNEIFSRIHPQGVIDIVSLATGFAMACNGPASAPVEDILKRDSTCRQSAVCGAIAGALASRNVNADQLIEILRQIDDSDISYRGGSLDIHIEVKTPQ